MFWYEREGGSLLEFEKECYFQFMKEYGHPDLKVTFSFDEKRRFCADVVMPVRAEPDAPWRIFRIHNVYEHDHPGRGEDGLFGGTIKSYPLTRLKPGFHHLISDSAMGLPYFCQVHTARSEEVNGYAAMKRVCRCLLNYLVWEKTGKDPDR